jgi:hypothetical protein
MPRAAIARPHGTDANTAVKHGPCSSCFSEPTAGCGWKQVVSQVPRAGVSGCEPSLDTYPHRSPPVGHAKDRVPKQTATGHGFAFATEGTKPILWSRLREGALVRARGNRMPGSAVSCLRSGIEKKPLCRQPRLSHHGCLPASPYPYHHQQPLLSLMMIRT